MSSRSWITFNELSHVYIKRSALLFGPLLPFIKDTLLLDHVSREDKSVGPNLPQLMHRAIRLINKFENASRYYAAVIKTAYPHDIINITQLFRGVPISSYQPVYI